MGRHAAAVDGTMAAPDAGAGQVTAPTRSELTEIGDWRTTGSRARSANARLGMRRPERTAPGSCHASIPPHEIVENLDAPTETLLIADPPAEETDLFSGRPLIAARDGSGKSPRDLWEAASARGRAKAVVGAAVALLAVAFAASPHASSNSSSVSTASTAPVEGSVVGTSAFGCDVLATPTSEKPHLSAADFVCTKNALVEKVCHTDLDYYDTYFTAAGDTVYQGYSGTIYFNWYARNIACSTDGGTHTIAWTGNEFWQMRQDGAVSRSLDSRLENARQGSRLRRHSLRREVRHWRHLT
ncbi:hypothetical protein [Actinomycetospora atypica]|uniref:Uncharacterized protein n=1 Tax=Actinomycetospora atypica TaxID=1290095 RepID=A0ABV9YPT5_9PSEU